MPREKYSKELKEKVVMEYGECRDAKVVADRYGILPKQVWTWVCLQKKKPMIDEKNLINRLQKKLHEKEEEIRLLREIVKKTAMVMPIN